MNEFFSLLDHDMFARMFIVGEVWISALAGYVVGYYSHKYSNKK